MTGPQIHFLFAEVKAIFDEDDAARSSKSVRVPAGSFSSVWGFQGYIPDLDPYNEVCKNIYIGNGIVATDVQKLRNLKVTHVLNAAHGTQFSQVYASAAMYQPFNITFFGIPAMDVMNYRISDYFTQANDFIDRAIRNGGVVYVHCHQGRSRSATLVLAYLMMTCGLSLQEAIRSVRRRRLITPNDGFLRQLCELAIQLKSK